MRRHHPLLATLVALTALSACGSPEQAAGTSSKVATLTSPEAGVSASPKPERPRERLDSTSEEYEAMLGPYHKCLKEHGVDPQSDRRKNSEMEESKTLKEQADKNTEADRICGPLYFPLPPWEKDPANPEARDFARAVVKCLKGKGVEYVETGDNGIDIALGGKQNDSRSISRGLDLMSGCERQAAATLTK